MSKIAFKEKDGEQYYKGSSGKWIKCDEVKIDSLWCIWVVSKNIKRYKDDNGFTVFDYKKES